MTVINFILLNEKLPKKDNCWECFQPKLFHYTTISVLTQLGLGKTTDDPNQRILIAQLINFVAGVITLIVIWIFIHQAQIQNHRLKLFAFALAAFNPPLIGISSQATNDAFVILFSALALYFANALLQKPKVLNLTLLILSATLAVSSKTNGWVLVMAIFVALLVKAWSQADQRGKSLALAFTFLPGVIILATLNPLNQYIVNYQKYGSPVLINMKKPAFPLFFEKTSIPDGGILSIQDGFFTFHAISLLERPQIDYGNWNFTPQRTSFWTQLYAKAYSIHFENFPPSWGNSQEYVFMVSRGILVLALIPTILLWAGFFIGLKDLLTGLFLEKFKRALPAESFGLFTLVFAGYIAFMIAYALIYRDFTAIKAIFIFPAMLAFLAIFLKAGQSLYSRFSRIIPFFELGLSALLLLQITDLLILIIQLQQHHPII